MQQIPTTFWPQLLVRLFKEKTPKFHAIITKNALWFTVASIAFPFVVTDFLPGIGIDVPQWLTYTNTKVVILCAALAGAGIGGAGIAQTAMQTASTPPLDSDKPAVSNEELAQIVAQLQAEIKANRPAEGPAQP